MYKALYKKLSNELFEEVKIKDLIKYSWMYIYKFGEIWDGKNGKYFLVDIYTSNYLVGINFVISTEKRNKQIIIKKIKGNSINEIKNIISDKIGIDKNKELMDFTKHSFYKIDGNHKLSWLPEIAINDINKIENAIMKK